MFSLICVWINLWVNNREGSDLRSYRAHYDIIVMNYTRSPPFPLYWIKHNACSNNSVSSWWIQTLKDAAKSSINKKTQENTDEHIFLGRTVLAHLVWDKDSRPLVSNGMPPHGAVTCCHSNDRSKTKGHPRIRICVTHRSKCLVKYIMQDTFLFYPKLLSPLICRN